MPSKYRDYFRTSNPFKCMPRTTRWRLSSSQLDHSDNGDEMSYVRPNITSDSVAVSPASTSSTTCLDTANVGATQPPTEGIDEGNGAESLINLLPSVEEELEDSIEMNTPEEDVWYEDLEDDCSWYDCQESASNDENASSGKSSDSSQKLFSGCPLSIRESLVLILLFSMRHNLTGECLADLLTLINLHCAIPNLCTSSLYLFRKHFADLKSPIVFHKFCSFCCNPLSECVVTCPVCKKVIKEDNVSFFIECPIVSQLQALFRRIGFYDDLQHRFTRSKKCQQNIEDIYDGSEYARHFGPDGLLNNKNNISFMWYTDGVPLFKSSKFCLWPICFSINELPYSKRMQKENLVFGGLWYGESKPLFHLFLKPCFETFETLTKGIEVQLPDNEKITVRGMLLCGTCDLPAKCAVLNMNQFNGKFGCHKCLQRGQSVETGRGHTWVYLYDIENPSSDRTHTQFCTDGTNATLTGKPQNGVKGPSWLSMCKGIDIVKGTGIDYMHCALLGIVRKLLHLWFDTTFSKEGYSLSRKLTEIDQRLRKIKPPSYVTRTPRTVKENLKYWKANECRAWLFFYSVPVLLGLMEPVYFEHYCLFVEAMFILNSSSISKLALKKSELLINNFCCMFEVLYGAQHMSANLHQILHLPKCVYELGPLWVFSCFKYEDFNGKMIQMFHGTKSPQVQICSTMAMLLNLPSMIQSFQANMCHPAKKFLSKLQSKHVEYGTHIFDECNLLGLTTNFVPDIEFLNAFEANFGFIPRSVKKFLRIRFCGMLIQGKHYTNVVTKNNSTIVYSGLNNLKAFGQVEYFLKCCCCDMQLQCHSICQPTFVAVVSCLPVLPCKFLVDEISNAEVSHISLVSTTTHSIDIIKITSIHSVAVFMPVAADEGKAFVAVPPNIKESD